MPDLGDLLAQAVESRARVLAGEAMDVGSAAALRGYVQHRRSVRRVRQAMVVTPVVAALVLGGWAAADRWRDVPPAVPTPSPSSTVSQTPTPSPSPTPSPTAALVALPEEGGLPSRYAAPDDVLEQAEPGWVLAIYEPSLRDSSSSGATTPSVAVAVLASPDGTAYELTRWDPRDGRTDGSWLSTDIVSWRAGDQTAVVNRNEVVITDASLTTTQAGTALLDLRTGEFSASGLPDHTGASLQTTVGDVQAWRDAASGAVTVEVPNGTVTVADAAWGEVSIGPDGRYIAIPMDGRTVSIVDARTATIVDTVSGPGTPDGWCEFVSWWTSESVLQVCYDSDPYVEGSVTQFHPRLVAVTVGAEGGTVVKAIGENEPLPDSWGATWVADHEVVAQGFLAGNVAAAYACWDGAYVFRDAATTPLSVGPADAELAAISANIFLTQASGGRIVVEATGGCSGDAVPSVLLSYDSQTLAPTVVLGLPYGTFGGDQTAAYLDGPASWALGR